MSLKKIEELVNTILEWLLISLMAANVLNVLWQVFTRFVLKSPSPFTEELARFLLIWVGLLGAGYAAGKKRHLAIDFFVNRLEARARWTAGLLVQFCVFVFAFLVMVVGGIRLVAITFALNQISAALRIKLGFVYLVLPVSGVLLLFYSVLFFVENYKKKERHIDKAGTLQPETEISGDG